MIDLLGWLFLIIVSVQIAIFDLRSHLIRNIDLFLLTLAMALTFRINLKFAAINTLIYLVIYILSRKKLGEGDVKLAACLGISFHSFFQLIVALDIAWIIGGLWAISTGKAKIAFAPPMLIGAFVAYIAMT
jgi:prepilin signal peptidase PulO-like enzyme (type II secretory pathway)